MNKYNARKVTFFGETFDSVKEGQRWLVLRDLEDDATVLIADGAEYTFFATPDTHLAGRFVIERSADAAGPAITTGLEQVSNGAEMNGIYTIEGKYIGSQLPAASGIYIIRRGQKAYKVVR